jgi:hypothetical protein
VTITSSSKPRPQKVVKVFYQHTREPEHNVELIEVGNDVTQDINGELVDVRGQMIHRPRLGEWHVAYLKY